MVVSFIIQMTTRQVGIQQQTMTVLQDLYSVAYGSGKFVASGYNRIITGQIPGGVVLVSNDNGTTWSLKTSDYVFEDLTYGNGKFIGVQFGQYFSVRLENERIYSSTDGENWTLVHDPNY